MPAPRILVVDDNPGVRTYLEVVLGHTSFVVHPAANGKEAVEFFTQHRDAIDLVLLDVNMPEPDGPQTYSLLKGLDPAVRVVFMSANPAPYTIPELLGMGALDVLEKPFFGMARLAHVLLRLATGG